MVSGEGAPGVAREPAVGVFGADDLFPGDIKNTKTEVVLGESSESTGGKIDTAVRCAAGTQVDNLDNDRFNVLVQEVGNLHALVAIFSVDHVHSANHGMNGSTVGRETIPAVAAGVLKINAGIPGTAPAALLQSRDAGVGEFHTPGKTTALLRGYGGCEEAGDDDCEADKDDG
jgi:hypothetical protein